MLNKSSPQINKNQISREDSSLEKEQYHPRQTKQQKNKEQQHSFKVSIMKYEFQAAERRREKRRKNKEKNKKRIQQKKQIAIANFQSIIKDIFILKKNFQGVKDMLEDCFVTEQNNQVLYDQIDDIMRQQIDLIRKNLALDLAKYSDLKFSKDQIIKIVFDYIYRIQMGSPEIEKVINLYVKKRFGASEEESSRTNLQLMTLKFLYQNDLQPSENFSQIVTQINNHSQKYQHQCEIYQLMLSAHNFYSSGYEEYESQEDDENQNQKSEERALKLNQSHKQQRHNKREKQKKYQLQDGQNFQYRLKYIGDMQIDPSRVDCRVEENWLEQLQIMADYYRKKGVRKSTYQ